MWRNGRLFFDADDGASGREVWVTDGTTTSLATDLAAPGQNPQIAWSAALGDGLAFATMAAPARLWITDGTSSGGTEPLATVAAAHLASGGGAVFFVGNAPATGREVWRTDGTWREPASCAVFRSTPFKPSDLTAAAATCLYFCATTSGRDTLWRSDGSAAGTFPIGPVPWYGMTAVGARLVYLRPDPATGLEPWVSDGTAAGTHILKDVCPGPCSSPRTASSSRRSGWATRAATCG